MKNTLLIALGIIFNFYSIAPVDAQHLWHFDGKNVLQSENTQVSLRLNNVRNRLESVAGVVGNGLRTDGYSTWLDGNFKYIGTPFSFSGWLALESYPTDTSAFIAVKDEKSGSSIALCIDRFGEILIGFGQDNEFTYYSSNHFIDRFKWNNLALSRDRKNIHVFINGVKINIKNPLNAPDKVNEVIVAKDFREKILGVQNLTGINGIVDEIKVDNKPIHIQNLQKEIADLSPKMPVLAVPQIRYDGDFSRPKYHLLPAANWTNETHGLIFHNNRYHIFNQKNASNLHLRQINWGHFSSPDLINWTEHKPAVSPEKGYDENGIWSGHVVKNDNGIPTIIYTTGGPKMGIGIAFPKSPDLVYWEKYERNPVVLGQPEGFSRNDLRDPYVWKEVDKWYMIIGFGIVEDGVEKGSLLLYSSPDLKKWDFIHTLFDGNPANDDSGIFWEMPVFEKIGEKYVLLINKVPHNRIPARAMYWVGDFIGEKFIPDNPVPKNLEVVNRLLSPSIAYDQNGLLTAIAIIPDEIREATAYQHGWTHCYSIPRVWELKNGKIIQTPHPALEKLRGKHSEISLTAINKDNPLVISRNLHQLEVKATINPNGSKKFGFTINKNPDNTEYSKIYYDAESREIVVDQTVSSLKENIPLNIRKGFYELDTSKPVDFHLFIDGSVVEVFINNEDAFTTRIFPLKENSNQVEIFCEDGNIEASTEVWELKPALIAADF